MALTNKTFKVTEDSDRELYIGANMNSTSYIKIHFPNGYVACFEDINMDFFNVDDLVGSFNSERYMVVMVNTKDPSQKLLLRSDSLGLTVKVVDTAFGTIVEEHYTDFKIEDVSKTIIL